MAAPHVAGVAALLWSAYPALRGRIDETEYVLNQTANHVDSFQCGSSGWPNHTYGFGHLDALAAVQAVREPAWVQGVVSQVACQPPVTTPATGAQLTFRASTGITTTVVASHGTFSLTLPPGPTAITATLPATSAVLTQTAWLLGNQDNGFEFTFARDGLHCLYLPLLRK
jgi:subtilisin family serine protease